MHDLHQGQHRYRGFISYSHGDKTWGDWLHRALETYRVPPNLVGNASPIGEIPPRLHPVFRDNEDATAGAQLSTVLQDALDSAAFLIVICSPRSAKSEWVNREIAYFKANRDPNRILCLIVDGTPGAAGIPGKEDEECFPPAIRFEVDSSENITSIPAEPPLAADVRPAADGRQMAKLRIIAPMLGVTLDELARREERRRANNARIIGGVSLAIASVMTVLALMAFQARNEAELQRTQAEGLVEFMIGDLRTKLQRNVQLEVLGDIAERAQAYYSVQADYRMDDDALGRRQRVLKLLGDLQADLGDADTAVTLMTQATGYSSTLLARDPSNPQRILEHAHALEGLGNLAFHHGDLDTAEKNMSEAVALTARLVEMGEQSEEFMAERGSAIANLGIVQLQQYHLEQSASNLRDALAIKQQVRAGNNDWQTRVDLAITTAWLGEALARAGDPVAAESLWREEEQIYLTLLSEDEHDHFTLGLYNVNRIKRAEILTFSDRIPDAVDLARLAAIEAESAVVADPSNTTHIGDAARAHIVLAQSELMAGRPDLALSAARVSVDLAVQLVGIDASRVDWNGATLGTARLLLAESSAAMSESIDECLQTLSQVTDEANRLQAMSTKHQHDMKLAQTLARARLLEGDAAAVAGDERLAQDRWRAAAAAITLAAREREARDVMSQYLFQQVDKRTTSNRSTTCRPMSDR